jgi:hypothetical protein
VSVSKENSLLRELLKNIIIFQYSMKTFTCYKASGTSIWKGQGVIFDSGKVAVNWICKKEGIDFVATTTSVAELTKHGDTEITDSQTFTGSVTHNNGITTMNITPYYGGTGLVTPLISSGIRGNVVLN